MQIYRMLAGFSGFKGFEVQAFASAHGILSIGH